MKFEWFCFAMLLFVNPLLIGTETLQECFSLQPLDSQTKSLLDDLKGQPHHPDMKDLPFPELRREEQNRPPAVLKKIPEIASIQNRSIPGPHGPIPVRLYTPAAKSNSLPVLIFFHGGGWVFGTLDDYDSLCQTLSGKAQCLVVSVDYHRAPEYPFPIPLQDCYEAVKWAVKHIAKYGGDPSNLTVGGDSAGGNLAAAVTLMARDLNEAKIKRQVLIYPVTACQFDTLSYECFREDYFLTREDMKFFWDLYAKGKDKNDPYLSPLGAKNLSALPRALLVVADYDVLRDEALAYGWRLQEAGVPVTLKKYGSIHGFLTFGSLDAGKRAADEIAAWLKEE